MAISKIGGSTSDNWELISSVTPTAASAAVNFTGLNLYKKLKVVYSGLTYSGSISLRINNDSSTNYLYSYYRYSSASSAFDAGFVEDTSFTLTSASSAAATGRGIATIENCDTVNLKTLSDAFGYAVDAISQSTPRTYYSAIYKASAVVTQVNLITSVSFSAAGTVALYGVK